MDVPEPDRKRAAMTHDMLKDLKNQLSSIDEKVDKIRKEQPKECAELMDNKITLNNKVRRKINIGQGGGAGAIILAIGEGIRALLK